VVRLAENKNQQRRKFDGTCRFYTCILWVFDCDFTMLY